MIHSKIDFSIQFSISVRFQKWNSLTVSATNIIGIYLKMHFWKLKSKAATIKFLHRTIKRSITVAQIWIIDVLIGDRIMNARVNWPRLNIIRNGACSTVNEKKLKYWLRCEIIIVQSTQTCTHVLKCALLYLVRSTNRLDVHSFRQCNIDRLPMTVLFILIIKRLRRLTYSS